jgi:hypothetical protein
MEMPRFSVELLVARRVIGDLYEKREGHLEDFVRSDHEGCP